MVEAVRRSNVETSGRLLEFGGSEYMILTDARLKSQPEVARVLSKAGRADTSTDVAPLSMLETVVVLKPRERWPRRLSQQELISKFDAAMKFPGVANIWTMPVRGRIDMLATGCAVLWG